MHVHPPKPLHGWREFAGEVGIIVLGVLIALGAEQAVERWHWNEQAGDAREALRAEVQDDDLPQAYARLAMAPCLDGRLRDLQLALDAHIDRASVVRLARGYSPPSRTWDAEAWNAVVATGVLAHGGSQKLVRWSLPYRMVIVLGPRNITEHNDLIDLRSISDAPGQLTAAERDRAVVALEHLRADESQMMSGSRVLLAAAAQTGVRLTDMQQKAVLDQLRPEWGACVTKPHWRQVDTETQSEGQFDGDPPAT